MRKHITMFLTNGFEPDVRVYKEAEYLISKGYKVTILCWDRDADSQRPERETLDGINVIRFKIPSVAGSGKKQLSAFFKYIKACRRYTKKVKSDYYHCNDIDGAIAWYLAKRDKADMVFDMHEYYENMAYEHPLKRIFWRRLTLFMIKRSVFALYENDLYLQKPYNQVRKKLVPLKNYPNRRMVKAVGKTQSDVFRIGYHGAVRSQIAEFTTLFEVVKDMQDVRVDIHGGGPDLKKLQEIALNYDNVTVHGPFNGTKELTALYADSDIIFAGYSTNVPGKEMEEVVKFYECIVTGTPIILTSGYIGMGRQIKEKGFGLTCDTRSVEKVRKAVMKLKDDKGFWKKCSENELEHAGEYDWANAVKILDKVYQ